MQQALTSSYLSVCNRTFPATTRKRKAERRQAFRLPTARSQVCLLVLTNQPLGKMFRGYPGRLPRTSLWCSTVKCPRSHYCTAYQVLVTSASSSIFSSSHADKNDSASCDRLSSSRSLFPSSTLLACCTRLCSVWGKKTKKKRRGKVTCSGIRGLLYAYHRVRASIRCENLRCIFRYSSAARRILTAPTR